MRIRRAASTITVAAAILGGRPARLPSRAVTYPVNTISPRGDTDWYKVRLVVKRTTVCTFAVDNLTPGFDVGFTVLVNGRQFVVNSRGAGKGETFRPTVPPQRTTATVIVGGIKGKTVGSYRLRVSP